MAAKEAQARIKINKLLEASGWRFLDDANGPANVVLEPNVKLTQIQIDAIGVDFETSNKGFIDFLLLNASGFPVVVLEAKAEGKNPLDGKEQARKYAKSQNCRFVILSNGNLHYLWGLQHGNPQVITEFPSPASFESYSAFKPDPSRLVTSSGFTIRCRFTAGVDPRFYARLFKSALHRELFRDAGRGASIRKLSQGMLKEIKFPLPDLSTQRAIVAEIEAEQAPVAANRELITCMEAKIRAVMDRVWGKNGTMTV